ncbi:MAG: DUF3303 domain-containing protein [Dehalococcoidia bacterium]
MSLFVVHHRHAAESCPAGNAEMAPMLLKLLSAENAAQHGITIHGEAVVDGAHTLYLIADAPSQAAMQQFMAPFAQAGSVEVLAASPCEAVVSRGSCAAA